MAHSILNQENYSQYIDVKKIIPVDEVLFKLKLAKESKKKDTELFLDFKEKFETLITETEIISVYGESLKNLNNNSSDKMPDPETYLLTSSRHFLKIVELSNEALKLGIEVNDNLIFRFRLYSAIGFFACRRHAISAALSNKLLESIENITGKDQILKEIYTLIIYFIGGKFTECQNISNTLLENIKSKLESQSYNQNWYHLPFFGVIVKEISYIVDCLINGNIKKIESHNKRIHETAIKINELGFTELSSILLKLSYSIEYLRDYSIWNLRNVLPDSTPRQKLEVYKFIKARIEEKKYFIFQSQYEALFKQKILDNQYNQLISMPTGAGKTLLGQLLVFKNLLLSERNGSKTLYIVPTRSLAQEKLDEFEEIFSIEGLKYSACKITGDALIESEDVFKNNDILIMTQEKFDMLLRENFYEESINLIVADEFHNIYEGYRGIKLLLSLERFKSNPNYKKSGIFLISAILSQDNQEDIVKWLYSEELQQKISFNTEWQPTFSRRGYFDYVNNYNEQFWPIEFNDGITLRLEKPEGQIDPKSILFPAAYITSQLAKDDCVYLYSHKSTDIIPNAKKIGTELIKEDYTYVNWLKNQEYSKRLRRILKDHPYCDAFESGVAVHYGKLPLSIRKIVEQSVRDKATPIIYATSTLAQGLNLPIKSIFIPYPKLGKDPMNIGSFLNLIGRAGRPYQTEEGQVILMTFGGKPGVKAFKKEEITRYLDFSSKDIKTEKNAIEIMLDKQSRGVNDTTSKIILGTLESLLLAGIAEDTIDYLKDNTRLIEVLSFGNDSSDYKHDLSNLLSEIQNRFLSEYKIVNEKNEKLKLNQRGLAFYKSGFTPSTSMEQINWINKNIDLITKLKFINFNIYDRNFGELWKRLLINLFSSIEGRSYLESEKVREKWIWSSLSWIREDPIELIANRGYKGDLLSTYSELEGNISGFLSWGLYAMSKWISLLNIPDSESTSNNFIELSKFVWYGINDPIAMKIMNDDVNRRLLRDDVIAIKKAIKQRKIKNFTNNPKLLNEEDVIDSLNKLPRLKYENSEVISILKRNYGLQ